MVPVDYTFFKVSLEENLQKVIPNKFYDLLWDKNVTVAECPWGVLWRDVR